MGQSVSGWVAFKLGACSLRTDVKHRGPDLKCLTEAREFKLVSQIVEIFGGSGSQKS